MPPRFGLTSPTPSVILASGADTPSEPTVSARRSPVGGCCLLLLWSVRQSPPLRGLWPLPQPPIRAILSDVGAPPGAPSGAPSRSGTSEPWPVDSDWNGGAPLGFVWVLPGKSSCVIIGMEPSMAFTDCTADLFGAEARADGSILISSAVKGPLCPPGGICPGRLDRRGFFCYLSH